MIWSSNQIGTIRARRLRRLLRRADHARHQREYAEAARLCQIALALDHRRADTRLQLGQMFKELARFGEAEAAFRQVLAPFAEQPRGATPAQTVVDAARPRRRGKDRLAGGAGAA